MILVIGLTCKLIDLAREDTVAANVFHGLMEAADAGEQIYEGEVRHTIPLYMVSWCGSEAYINLALVC